MNLISMWGNLKIVQKGFILVGLLVALEMSLALLLSSMLHEAEKLAARESYYNSISNKTCQLLDLTFESNACLLCYVWGAGQPYGKRFRDATSEIDRQYGELELLLRRDNVYASRLRHCRELNATMAPILWEIVSLVEKGDRQAAFQLFASSRLKEAMESVLSTLDSFVQEQEPIIQENVRSRVRATESVKRLILFGLAANVMFAIILSLLLVRGITKRLATVVDNTRRLASDKPLNPPWEGGDEVAHLDRVFHHMASVLAETARKERAMVENACDVICSVDRDGQFLKVSPASLQVWGLEPDRLIGNAISTIVLEEDLAPTIEAIDRLRAESSMSSFENRIRHQDGSVLNMLWSAHWSQSDQCMFCVVHDITEHKRTQDQLKASETALRTILEHTRVGIMTLGEDGSIGHVNPRGEEMLQFSSHELIGTQLSSVFAKTDTGIEASSWEALRRKLSRRPVSLTALRKDGSTLPVEASLSEFTDLGGRHLLANLVDITERQKLQRVKAEFVDAISSNLRLPLDSMRQFLELVGSGEYGAGLKARGRDGAQMAGRNIERLLRMIRDLTETTRFESGKITLEPTSGPLEATLERAVEAVRALAEKHSVLVAYPQVDLRIFADHDKLERVLVNLLSNAVKFSPPGSEVTVLVEPQLDRVLLKVLDRGRGVPESHRQVIFERFRQVEASDARHRGGTGLGLAICKAIIEEHGGEIGVNSELGKGSTFWFWIPRNG